MAAHPGGPFRESALAAHGTRRTVRLPSLDPSWQGWVSWGLTVSVVVLMVVALGWPLDDVTTGPALMRRDEGAARSTVTTLLPSRLTRHLRPGQPMHVRLLASGRAFDAVVSQVGAAGPSELTALGRAAAGGEPVEWVVAETDAAPDEAVSPALASVTVQQVRLLDALFLR